MSRQQSLVRTLILVPPSYLVITFFFAAPAFVLNSPSFIPQILIVLGKPEQD